MKSDKLILMAREDNRSNLRFVKTTIETKWGTSLETFKLSILQKVTNGFTVGIGHSKTFRWTLNSDNFKFKDY